MERVDLGAALGHEGRMLLCAVHVNAGNPEHWVMHAVADRIGTAVRWNLQGPVETERAQSCVVEGSGKRDI